MSLREPRVFRGFSIYEFNWNIVIRFDFIQLFRFKRILLKKINLISNGNQIIHSLLALWCWKSIPITCSSFQLLKKKEIAQFHMKLLLLLDFLYFFVFSNFLIFLFLSFKQFLTKSWINNFQNNFQSIFFKILSNY